MPQRLSSESHAQAVEFLNTHARPLERALYRFCLNDGSVQDVFTTLAAFQNDDGGFGHGLEPDVRLPDSSVLATTIAFQHFRTTAAPADHPLVTGACTYLRDTYNADTGIWRIIPPNVDDAPHAPWWVYREDPAAYAANPRAEIAGYLHDYAKHFPDEMRQRVTSAVVEHLLALDRIEMHDLLCYLRLYDTPTLPGGTRARMTDKLTELVRATVETDPSQWSGYVLQPLDVVTTPESPFAELFGDLLEENINARIAAQNADGSWSPPWSWGDLYPETWPQARTEWAGVLTLKNLRILRAFHCLD